MMKGQVHDPGQARAARFHPDRLRRRGDDPRARRAARGDAEARLPVRRERREPVHGPALRRARRPLQAQALPAQGRATRSLNALQARFEPTLRRRSRRSSAPVRRPSRARRARLASLREEGGAGRCAPAAKALESVARARGEDRRDPCASSSRSRRATTAPSTARTPAPRTRAPRTRTARSCAGRPRRSTGPTG